MSSLGGANHLVFLSTSFYINMIDWNIVLPSKPKVIKEENNTGIYEVNGLYPGYGHTLGNSLRRIILSSLPGAAITLVKINEVPHEFSTIEGVKEDVITILLNLKRVRFKMLTDEEQTVSLNIKGKKEVTAADFDLPGQLEILNPEQPIASLTTKDAKLDIEVKVEKGLGYVSKENHIREKVDVGQIAVDAVFTPIRRVIYEVENMRVGDRTNFNKLRLTIETDGTFTPREGLENAVEIMITQLKAIIGFQDTETDLLSKEVEERNEAATKSEDMTEYLKTRIDTMDFSTRTSNALASANIRTVGGLARKKETDLLEIEGLGEKGLQEIKDKLISVGVSLKEE